MENNLKNLTDLQLISELEDRGYTMSFILSKEDVELELEYINQEREEYEQISLTDDDKKDILDSLVNGSYGQHAHEIMCNAINESILSDYID